MRQVVRHIYCHEGKDIHKIARLDERLFGKTLPGNMIVSDQMPDPDDALNERGQRWTSPWDLSKSFDRNVWEMYDNAVERYQEYAESTAPLPGTMMRRAKMLEQHKSRAGMAGRTLAMQIPEVAARLENRSYHTGQPLS